MYFAIISAFRALVWPKEGLAGIYRGLFPTICKSASNQVLYSTLAITCSNAGMVSTSSYCMLVCRDDPEPHSLQM